MNCGERALKTSSLYLLHLHFTISGWENVCWWNGFKKILGSSGAYPLHRSAVLHRKRLCNSKLKSQQKNDDVFLFIHLKICICWQNPVKQACPAWRCDDYGPSMEMWWLWLLWVSRGCMSETLNTVNENGVRMEWKWNEMEWIWIEKGMKMEWKWNENGMKM